MELQIVCFIISFLDHVCAISAIKSWLQVELLPDKTRLCIWL